MAYTQKQIRQALRLHYGKRNYRITPTGEVHGRNEGGIWIFLRYMGERDFNAYISNIRQCAGLEVRNV